MSPIKSYIQPFYVTTVNTEWLKRATRKGTFLKTFLRLSVEAYTLRLEGQRQENCLEF